jgi:hypothetical protein
MEQNDAITASETAGGILTSRNEMNRMCHALHGAGFTGIAVTRQFKSSLSTISAVGPHGPVLFTQMREVWAAVKDVRDATLQCGMAWGHCEEGHAHDCGVSLTAEGREHAHRCQFCGSENFPAAPAPRRVGFTVSARVTDWGVRYTAERMGDDPGSLAWGDRIAVRQALTASGIPITVAGKILDAAYARRDEEAITAIVKDDGQITF